MVSWVWTYFSKLTNSEKAICNVRSGGVVCGARITRSGGNTKGMQDHLKLHRIFNPKNGEHSQESTEVASGSKSMQTTMMDFTSRSKKKSLEEIVSKMVAKSGFSISAITKDDYIRKCLVRDFPNEIIPRNPSGMMKLIVKFYMKIKEETKTFIAEHIASRKRFSCTLDEWTSLKNLKYLNVNLHYKNDDSSHHHINLGMIEIEGSCEAPTLLRLVIKL